MPDVCFAMSVCSYFAIYSPLQFIAVHPSLLMPSADGRASTRPLTFPSASAVLTDSPVVLPPFGDKRAHLFSHNLLSLEFTYK